MDFVDTTVVALAGESTRAGVFDSESLEAVLEATYDVDAMGPIAGTLTPLFDELEVGYAAPQPSTLEGAWHPVAEPAQRNEARFQLSGLPGEEALRVDAMWRGSILARYAEAQDRIVDVSVAWPDKEAVDAAVAAANGGSLPTGSTLEQGRKTALLDQIRSSLADPTAFTEDRLDAVRRTVGAGSIGGLLDRLRDPERGVAQIVFPDPAPVATTRRPLPVAVALLIRDAPFSVAELLSQSKVVRTRLMSLGAGLPKDDALRQRQRLTVGWVVPASMFTDTDWPGADDDERRANAAKWLSREGIGLVAV
jgi:hypothetical protein